GCAALRMCNRVLAIDTDVPHAREVDAEPVVDRAVAGRIVAPASARDLEALSLAEGKSSRHVVRIDAARDRRGATIDQNVEAEAGPFVLAVSFDPQVAPRQTPEFARG